MVTKKFTIYTKHQKLALKILDMIQVFLGLFLTSFIVLAMLVAQKKLSTWNIILGVAGIISLVEIVIRKAYNKQSFFYKLLLKLFKSNIALFPPTPMQLEVCSWINAKIQNGKGILIYGKANIGKTSSIFIYLSQHTKDKDLLQQLKWTESIIYVDCKNNKGDIAYAMEHAACQQGETLLVKCCHEGEGETPQHILMYTLDGETMRIVESTLNLSQLPKLLPLLARRAAELHPESRKVRSFEYRLPDGMVWLPERLKTTRLKRRGYFNLVLD